MTADLHADCDVRLRAEAAAALARVAPAAFLRWSRGDGLLITDATRRGADPSALAAALTALGWTASPYAGSLLELSPEPERLRTLEACLPARGPLAPGLARFRGGEILPEDVRLALAIIKLTALGGDSAAPEKRVRQRAALALRTGRGGGLLYLSAALLKARRAPVRADRA